MPSDVPGVRNQIISILQSSEGDDIVIHRSVLSDWVGKLIRSKPVRRSPVRSNAVTLDIAKKVWRLYRTGCDHQQIADALSINSGRVSEVINGLRHPGARHAK